MAGARRWARDFFDAMQPHARGRVDVYLLGDAGQDRVRAAYGERNYEWLATLKRAHDPTHGYADYASRPHESELLAHSFRRPSG